MAETTPKKEAPKKTSLIANTVCNVEEGETQSCWGSQFVATEIPNPELKEEFPEEAAPKTILVLKGSFEKKEEIESLLKAKRAIRA